MKQSTFNDWLKKLKSAWETKDPKLAIELCAKNFIWHEAPFEKPIRTKGDLLEEWQSVLDHDEVRMTYEILSVNKDFGIAKWHASFIRLPSKEKAELEGIFKVTLDTNGLCTEFHQWYNSK